MTLQLGSLGSIRGGFKPPAGLLAREALRGRGLELPDRRLYIPDHRIRLPERDVRERLRRATPQAFNIGTAQNGFASSLTVTAVTVAIHNLVVVAVQADNDTSAGTVSDTQSNTYALLTSANPNGNSGNGTTQLFWSVLTHALGGTDTIKYTAVSGNQAIAISAFYATGCATSSPVDTAVTTTATGASTTPSGTGGTPSQSGELWIAVVGTNTTITTLTNGGSWVAPPNFVHATNNAVGGGNQVGGASALSYSATLSGVANWALLIAAFKPAADVLMAQILM